MNEAKSELDLRLAKGEISIEEYNILLKAIGDRKVRVRKTNNLERKSGGSGFLIFLMLLIMAGIATAGSLNVVNTKAGLKFYPKKEFSLQDPYVDLTSTSFIGLRNHSELVETMVSAGDTRLFPGGATLMEAAQVGMEANEAINKFNSEYKVTSSIQELNRIGTNKFEELDNKYNVRDKADKMNNKLKQGAQKLNDWLKKQ